MPKKRAEPVVITEEEILKHANAPVYLEARYIGWSTTTLYYALRDGPLWLCDVPRERAGGNRLDVQHLPAPADRRQKQDAALHGAA